MYLYNARLPLTASNLSAVLEYVRPKVLHAVPYVLKLLAEEPRGIKAMRTCSLVTFVGSQCPDALGDRIVKQGINLVTLCGSYVSLRSFLYHRSLREPGAPC